MRRLVWCLIPLLLFGCSSGNYKIAKDEYRERVRILGVLPLMVDAGSTINHPERQRIVELVQRHNAGKSEELIEMLRAQKGYFDVRAVDGNPEQLFGKLVQGSTLRNHGPALYRRYQFNPAAVAALADSNVVDALLLVVVNGVERTETRRDRGPLLSYLEAPYNSLLMTATVVLPSGEIAWEYSGVPGESFLPLQYAAFEEAFYHRTDEVKIRYISVDGLERALTEVEKSLFGGNRLPRAYAASFEQIVDAMHPGFMLPQLRNGESK